MTDGELAKSIPLKGNKAGLIPVNTYGNSLFHLETMCGGEKSCVAVIQMSQGETKMIHKDTVVATVVPAKVREL